MRPILRGLTAIVTILAAFVGASAASATVTVGQLSGPNPKAACMGGPDDVYQSSLSGGTSYVVPAAGILTSWSTEAAEGAGQTLKMKVFQPLGGNSFKVVGHNGPQALTPATLNTFPAHIAVQAGDVIGFNDQNATAVHNACLFETGNASDIFAANPGLSDAEDGSNVEMAPTADGYRLNLSATLLEVPTITAVSPTAGPAAGGTAVTISGTEFAEVQSVRFGSVPAASVTVASESQIVAGAPAGAAGSVPVTVTTSAGTATASQQFSFQAPPSPGCIVPKLKGSSLKSAKRKILGGGCQIGQVKRRKGVKAKTAKVVGQNKKPGAVLPARTVIRITLGNP